MMEATPTLAFVMTEADLLLEFEIVALDRKRCSGALV
jgi:hypothetical protein